MLVDIMVAAMPHFPALPQEPGRDFTPVSLKGQSGDGGSSALYANICASAIIVHVLQALPPSPTAPIRLCAQIWRFGVTGFAHMRQGRGQAVSADLIPSFVSRDVI